MAALTRLEDVAVTSGRERLMSRVMWKMRWCFGQIEVFIRDQQSGEW